MGFVFVQLGQVVFKYLNVFLFFGHAFDKFLTHCLLMVTQNGHLFVGLFVFGLFLIHGQAIEFALVELILQGTGGVVSSENFGGQSFQKFFQVIIQSLSINFIKKNFSGLLFLHENLNVPPDFWNDGDNVVVSHTVLTQEVKLNLIFRQEFDMLDSQRTAANGIGFVFAFFVTDS